MTTDLNKLKTLATAAAANQYNAVALNDYGTAVPPATVLDLIAEIERHRLVNVEGCKPDSNILLGGLPCTGFAPCRSLNKAEGCKPDLKSPIHPDDIEAITKWHREFLQLTDYGWPDDVSSLQDQAYALGRDRGQDDWLAEQRQITAALREEIERLQRRIQNADLALKAQTQNCDTLRAQQAIARAALQKVMNATDESQDDGAHHKNAYSIADHALNNMTAACQHLNVAPRSTITDGKLIGYFCKDCGLPSARPEPSAPKCELCDGDGYHHVPRTPGTNCDACKGTGLANPSAPVERADPGTQVPLSRIREAMEFSAAGFRGAELQIGETHLRVTYHGIKWYHDRRHCNRWEPMAIEEFDDLLCFALNREVQS